MTIDIKNIGDVFIYLGALATALIAIGVVLKFVVVRPLIKRLKAELVSVHEKTDIVVNEVTPNHGSSMKDQIGRTEVKIDALEARFSDHIVNHPK